MRKRIAHAVKHAKKHLSRTDIVVVAAAAMVLIVGLYSIWLTNSALGELSVITGNFTENINVLNQTVTLPVISAEVISVVNCTGCTSLSPILTAVNASSNLTVTQLAYGSTDAQALMGTYSITRLPAIVFTGEVNKSQTVVGVLSAARKSGSAYVLESETPPYYLANESRLAGLVNVTVINISDCRECLPAQLIISQLRGMNVTMRDVTWDSNTTEGQALISRYNITKLPAMIFSKDLLLYKALPDLSQVMSAESDGNLVWRYYNIPYREVNGTLRGSVNMIMLNDSTCGPCYNVSVNVDGLTRMGIFIANATTYDINSTEGRALLQRYNITKVPTFLLSPDASIYPALMQVWPSAGTVEPDGWFVFRNLDAMTGLSYKDLTNNTIIVKEAQPQPT